MADLALTSGWMMGFEVFADEEDAKEEKGCDGETSDGCEN